MDTATITPGHWLRADAAASYARMRAAGMPAGITSAGRTYAEQVAIFTSLYSQVNTGRDYQRWDGRDWWRKNDGGTGYAAPPGTSTHETGVSLDLPEPARAWVRAHGVAYGWRHDTVRGEPWHMTYYPGDDQHQEDDVALTQDDLERVKEASANGLTVLLAEAAAGSTTRGRQAAAALRAITAVDADALADAVADALPATGGGITKAQVRQAAKAALVDVLTGGTGKA
ncbi:M15 family metallopeptidase [Cellulomonas composti]|uniref:D-alanyl-D-alanine carboxypeptidase-like core domain-containing protein n=1 Tax=Cellulomonas composti TaxID=266130 RepID=A0A511JBI3_9CELL|nr:M15 family metallopeptidase [Cellulomonas composti]GEL95350.1 hypothetical protein CCO02nite_20080 [Cellulomonas composti]